MYFVPHCLVAYSTFRISSDSTDASGNWQVHQSSRRSLGYTPLIYAAQGGNEAIVKLLVLTGDAHVNATDRKGGKALFHACAGGFVRIVEILLATGEALVSITDLGR